MLFLLLNEIKFNDKDFLFYNLYSITWLLQ